MIRKVRENIILEDDILYLDYTASGLAYQPIEEKLQDILKTYANTHSEVGYNAHKTQEHYEKARASLKKSLGIDNSFYIIPCGTGATAAIKKFQELMGLYIPPATKKRYSIDAKELPLVIVGPFEHHSNEVSFREALCEVERVPLNKNQEIDLDALKALLEANKGREIIGTFAVASNVTGIINPYKKIFKLLKQYGARVCLDAAASSAYMNVESRYYDVMFLSPHKLIGGPGSCGLLVIKKNLCSAYGVPTFAGGGTVTYVSRESHSFSTRVETKEDAGTPGILQFIKAALAYELRNEVGLTLIAQQEETLKEHFAKLIVDVKDVTLYCSKEHDKLAIFSLNIKDIYPYKLADILSKEFKIQTRAGCSCAGPYGHDLLNLKDGQSFLKKPGWIRVSFHYTHTLEEVDYFVSSLKKSIEIAKKMSKYLFFIIFFSVLSLVSVYTYKRFINKLFFPRVYKNAAKVFLAAMLAGLFFYILSRYNSFLPPWLYYIFSYSVGIIFMCFSTAVVYDVLRTSARFAPVNDKRRDFFKRIFDITAVIIFFTYLFKGLYNGQQKPKINKQDIKIKDLKKPLKIAQISDLHVGSAVKREYVENIVKEINAQKVDIVALTGDLIDFDTHAITHDLEPLAHLESKYGTFFVLGNHEYFHNPYSALEYLDSIGIYILDNKNATIDNLINLAGINDRVGERFNTLIPDAKKTFAGIDESLPTITLAHQPKMIERLEAYKPDLVLSGHTHGGQIFPFGLFVLLDQPYLTGLYQHNEHTQIYVSEGAGYWGPPIRFLTQSEINILTLKA